MPEHGDAEFVEVLRALHRGVEQVADDDEREAEQQADHEAEADVEHLVRLDRAARDGRGVDHAELDDGVAVRAAGCSVFSTTMPNAFATSFASFAAVLGERSVTCRLISTLFGGASEVILSASCCGVRARSYLVDGRAGDLRAGGDARVGLHPVLDEVVALREAGLRAVRHAAVGRDEQLDVGPVHLRRGQREPDAGRHAEHDAHQDQCPFPAHDAQVIAQIHGGAHSLRRGPQQDNPVISCAGGV